MTPKPRSEMLIEASKSSNKPQMSSPNTVTMTVTSQSNPANADGLPSARTLAMEHKKLKDRSRILRKRLVTADVGASSLYEIVREACLDSLKVVSERLEDEALILLGDLNHLENKNDLKFVEDYAPCAVSSHVTPWHAVWAQRRAHMYLDAVEKVSENTVAAAKQLEKTGIYDLIKAQKKEHSNITSISDDQYPGTAALMVSPWCLPKLVFDVLIGGPATYFNLRTSEESTLGSKFSSKTDGGSSSRRRKRANSGLSDAIFCKANNSTHCQLPLSIQVRAVSEVYLTGEGYATQTTPISSKCEIEIVRVLHEKCTHSLAYGDVSILLSLRKILDELSSTYESDSYKSIQVSQARMVQVNALPPQPHASIDLYTTSVKDSEEITIALRFLTKRSHSNAPPHLHIDILVK